MTAVIPQGLGDEVSADLISEQMYSLVLNRHAEASAESGLPVEISKQKFEQWRTNFEDAERK